MKLPGSRAKWIIAIVVMAAITSAWGISAMRESRDNVKVRTMTQKMKTICVGRFLIDLPEKSKVRFGTPRIAGVTINTTLNYTDEQLELKIKEREEGLSVERNEYGAFSLEKKVNFEAENLNAVLLYYGRKKPLEMIEYGKPVKGTEEGIAVEAFGIKRGKFYRFFGEDLASPRSEGNVLSLVKKFEARDAEFVPEKPGFCIKNGLIRDPLTPDDNEMITMFVSLEEYPDIVIRLDTSINVDDMVEPLFERESKNDIKRNYASHFKSLRYAKRTLNGIDGEEIGEKIKELNGTSAHSFMWISIGKMRDVLAPAITLELHTGRGRPGEPQNSSLSDEAVLQLWDRIASSLRLRPTSSTASVAIPAVPLGELVTTGLPCPQTGYWECTESSRVEGDRQRFFKTGEQMPHVTVRALPNLWQRLRGDQPVRRLRTMWKLVAYETTLDKQVEAQTGKAIDDQPVDENNQLDRRLNGGSRIADSDSNQA